MTLSEWIQRHAKNPILVVVLLALGIQVLYFCFLGYNRYTEQLEKIELLRESISMGVQQSNRPLIESAMMTSLSNPYISAVLLCANHEAQMLYPADSRNYCKDTGTTIKAWPIKRRIIGSQDIYLVVILSPVVAFTPMVFLVSISFVMAGTIFWLLIRVRKRFEAEILNPISEGLSADIPLGVKELEELRFKILEKARLEREKAHLEAMFNLSTQVAHDIRSPLVALDAALKHT
jgi:signal transduction histidine kinase